MVSSKRTYIRPAYNLAKKIMPKISDTEAAALSSGTISWDQDLFSGDLALKKLVDTYDSKLTAEEQSFLDNETEVLCEMLDQHQIEKAQNLSPEVWPCIRGKCNVFERVYKERVGVREKSDKCLPPFLNSCVCV